MTSRAKTTRRLAPMTAAALLLLLACARPPFYTFPPESTGTCQGACHHYVWCKRASDGEHSSDAQVYRACVAECREIFADSESLRAFERLECDVAVSYVEGESGRRPGD